jgi:hypothetical protein
MAHFEDIPYRKNAMLLGPIKRLKWLFFSVGFLTVILLSCVIHKTIDIPLIGGGSIRLTQPSVLELVFKSTSTMAFNSGPGKEDIVILRRDYFDSPVIVIPSTKSNLFFCVYDNDVDWQLIRVDVSGQFRPLPRTNPLCDVVQFATCKIERVLKTDTNDWNLVAIALEKMSETEYKDQSLGLNLFGYRVRADRKKLAASMRNFGDQGQYPGDTIIPWYIKEYQKTHHPVRTERLRTDL